MTGPQRQAHGFFVRIGDPNPDSEYLLTTYSAVSGACRVAVELPQAKRSSSKTWGHVLAVDRHRNLAVVEVPGKSAAPVYPVDLSPGESPSAFDVLFAVGYGGTGLTPPLRLPVGKPEPDQTANYLGAPVMDRYGQVQGMVVDGSSHASPYNGLSSITSVSQRIVEEVIQSTRNQPASLNTTPTEPIAGREVAFELQTQPNRIVEIAHLNPNQDEVPWVFPNGRIDTKDGEPITTKELGADPCGRVTWTRPGTLDVEGGWTLRVKSDPYSDSPITSYLPYSVSQLELDGQGTLDLWAALSSIEGEGSIAYYSASVPTALALDLMDRLVQVSELLQDRLDVSGTKIPDLYILGNEMEYDQVVRFIGQDPGWETGFYRPPCPQCPRDRPGLYLRAYRFRSRESMNILLTHEYTHALVREITEGKGGVLTVWINEGLADWSAFEVRLPEDSAQTVLKVRSFHTEKALSAAGSGRLFGLSSLESRHSWSKRSGDQVAQQYAQSYVAMRYMIENYGITAAVGLLKDKARGYSWALAMEQHLGVGYSQFESDLVSWLNSKEPSDAPRERGEAHYDEGKYSQAIAEYSTAIELNPYRDDYLVRRGWAYERLNEHQNALEDANLAIQIDPGDPRGYDLRAQAFHGLGRYEEAIADFSKAIGLNPHKDYYEGRGIAHYRLAQYEHALGDLGRAIRIDPNYAQAYDWRAATHGVLGNEAQKLADQRKACSLDSTLRSC